jgi:FkbM family methyltransferase
LNPSYLLSEWAFALRRGTRPIDRWKLASSSLLGRFRFRFLERSGIDRVSLQVGSDEVTVALRRHTDDAGVLMQVFHYGEYDTNLIDWRSVRTVVDAGANIGLSSVLFGRRAPGARILAIEPEPTNLELLRQNLLELNGLDAQILPAALWPERQELTLQIRDASVSHSVLAGGAEAAPRGLAVDTVTPAMLLDCLQGADIDLFKIDIEGAERDIFTHPSLGQWIRSVRYLLIECHSHFGFGASPREIEMALEPHGFIVVTYQPEKGLVCAFRKQ